MSWPGVEPTDFEFEYKAILTNKTVTAATVVAFFNGSRLQEQVLAEAMQHANLDYVPCKRLLPNQLYVLGTMLAHKPRARAAVAGGTRAKQDDSNARRGVRPADTRNNPRPARSPRWRIVPT